jgi:hypothetical protein
MRADGTNARRVTVGKGDALFPSWSSDRERSCSPISRATGPPATTSTSSGRPARVYGG